MKIFVVGARGYLGGAAAAFLTGKGWDVISVSSRPEAEMLHLDLTEASAFPYHQVNAGDLVLMTAAVSSPDFCRDQPELARAINVTGSGYFIGRCLDAGARVVFFSSDTVYGGGDTERTEAGLCHPAGEYAAMKREVEARFADHPDFKVLRLSYVFSRADKFTSYLLASAREGKEAGLFHPMLRRCVYLGDLLDLVGMLCSSWEEVEERIVNIGGPQLLSRVEMAELFREVVLPGLSYQVIEPPAGFFDARPQVINMSDVIFKKLLGRATTGMSEAMQREFSIREGLS